MSNFSDIMLIIGIILAIIALFGYVYVTYRLFRDKKKTKKEYKQKTHLYPTASAGTEDSKGDAFASSISVADNEFRTKDGDILDVHQYDQYVVSGNSMQYCGIFDKDLIFTRKGFKISDLRPFPSVIVLGKRNITDNSPKYKIRRAWAYCDIVDDDIDEILKDILDPQNFKSVRDIDYYDGDNALLENFHKEKLPRYKKKYIDNNNANANDRKVVISTTFHTNEKKVRFSIHPASSIMGIVEESFTIKQH